MIKVENLDINKCKFNFSVDAARFEEGLEFSFKKNKKNFKLPGFRKGKLSRKLVEKMYGVEVLFDDAINFVLQDAYAKAADESKLEIVSRPEIDVISASVENGVEFSAIVYTKPEVKLGDYKNLPYKAKDTSVSKEDIEDACTREREKHAKITSVLDRPVQKGDLANINFEGFIDGVAFDGGKGENYDLEIGSKSFIDNFEDQLIGKNIGEEVEVKVTFPKEYGKEDLNGKDALFKVQINGINSKSLPELNDEFVQDISEFETVAEYKKSLKTKLTETKKAEAEKEIKEEISTALIEKAEMKLPEAMIELEIDNKINQFASNIQAQGLSLKNYLDYMGQTLQTMREAYRLISEKQIRTRLALEAVAEAEKIKVTSKDIDNEIKKIAGNYKMEKEAIEKLLSDNEKEAITKDLKVEKALDFLVKNAKEVK